jgi:hypothetical protein
MVLVLKDLDLKMVLDLKVDNITDQDLKDLDLKMVLDRKVDQDLKMVLDLRVGNKTVHVLVEKILLATTHKKKTSNSRSFFYLKGAS